MHYKAKSSWFGSKRICRALCLTFTGAISINAGAWPSPDSSASSLNVNAAANVPSLQIAVWWAQIFTGLGTLAILFLSVVTTARLKRAEFMMACHQRYDLLFDLRQRLLKQPNEAETKLYFERFWQLQESQFKYWQIRMLDNRLYAEWMHLRRSEHDANETVGTMTYREGWKDVKEHLDRGFQSFMAHVFSDNEESAMKRCTGIRRRLFADAGSPISSTSRSAPTIMQISSIVPFIHRPAQRDF
jgi:hypothetical protein